MEETRLAACRRIGGLERSRVPRFEANQRDGDGPRRRGREDGTDTPRAL
jgi:hypothetical protein